MITAQFQKTVNDYWKQKTRAISPTKQRRMKYCPKCGKAGYEVKMDYKRNVHETHMVSRYNVDIYLCPRCNHIERDMQRMEGRGKKGHNLGKMHGGM